MNYICTWICVDEKGEESYFPQTGKLSSSKDHQDIYWRCVLAFFITSLRFNRNHQHLLFTNAETLPEVDGRPVKELLDQLSVEVVFTDFKYKTPPGYFFSFQNQFYEFSILEHIARARASENDSYLILDSDCIFLKPADELFKAAAPRGFISFEDDVKPDYVINGLSRNHLKSIYEELLGHPLDTIPAYHLGEFFLASYVNIKQIAEDFRGLWPVLLERHAAGRLKFNEEAHTLSYLYFKNGLVAGERDSFIKRIWTNPAFYRNVSNKDTELAIWHLPAEKTYGIHQLYRNFMARPNFGFAVPDEMFLMNIRQVMGIPHLPVIMRCRYFLFSYYRALQKRIKKLPVVRNLNLSIK